MPCNKLVTGLIKQVGEKYQCDLDNKSDYKSDIASNWQLTVLLLIYYNISYSDVNAIFLRHHMLYIKGTFAHNAGLPSYTDGRIQGEP